MSSHTAIIVVVIAFILGAVVTVVAVSAAKQKRAAKRLRARLRATVDVQRRAQGVSVVVLQKVGRAVTQVVIKAECALTPDSLYCLAEESPWGARVCLSASPDGPGDTVLAQAPSLFSEQTVISPGVLAPWVEARLASLPPNGVLLQLAHNVAWHLSLTEPDQWFAMLCLAARVPNVTVSRHS